MERDYQANTAPYLTWTASEDDTEPMAPAGSPPLYEHEGGTDRIMAKGAREVFAERTAGQTPARSPSSSEMESMTDRHQVEALREVREEKEREKMEREASNGARGLEEGLSGFAEPEPRLFRHVLRARCADCRCARYEPGPPCIGPKNLARPRFFENVAKRQRRFFQRQIAAAHSRANCVEYCALSAPSA
jgi:hypothetical protein